MEKVNYEIATNDVKSWLDHKRVPQGKRDSLQGMIDNLTGAIAEGNLVLEEDMKWRHVLVFPLENERGEVSVGEITYKPRISDAQLEPYKKLIKGTDFDSTLKRTILALTNQPIGIINNLDSSTDRQIAESIAVFFV